MSAWKVADTGQAPHVDDDLSLARTCGGNVLLIGDDPDVSNAAASLAGSAGSATVTLWAANVHRLAPQAQHFVVIARGVDEFGAAEQRQMLHWLDVEGRHARVISTASPALWPKVRDGAFCPELYYRLNTVCVRC
jgi:sigma-54-interacting transcriptional regulator